MLDQARTRQVLGIGVALLLFGGGVALGHSTTSSSSDSAKPAPAPAPATSDNSTGAAGLGASRVVSNIPVGYPHTKGGALSAAANYTAAVGSPQILNPEGRAAVVSAIAAPAAAAAVRQQLDGAGSGSLDQIRNDAANKTPFGFATVPLALRLDGAFGDQVTVQVYAITYLASSTATAAGGYGQGTVHLTWTDGDWKLASYSTTSATGPVPVGYYAPSTGWQPANGSSLYDVSSQFRRTMTDGTVPGYVIP